jgi:hypothetical protein
MNNFLFKIGLIDKLTLELDTSSEVFVKRFQEHVDPDQFELFEIFSRSKNQYKGAISLNNFQMKKRRSFTTSNFSRGTATANFFQRNGKVVVEASITSVNSLYIRFFLFFFGIVYGIALFTITVSGLQDESSNMPLWTIPFILVHAAFMLGIPYLILKSTVRKMKYELERDLYFMIR